MLAWRWRPGVSGCPRESQSYKLSTVIVGTIYDASGAVTIDREVALPMREAKTWRRGHQEGAERGGEGPWTSSIERGLALMGIIGCGLVCHLSNAVISRSQLMMVMVGWNHSIVLSVRKMCVTSEKPRWSKGKLQISRIWTPNQRHQIVVATAILPYSKRNKQSLWLLPVVITSS